MKPRAHSSLTAFLAHYASLRRAREHGTLASAAAQTLASMEASIGELSEAERAALTAQTADSSAPAARRRARAELRLARILAARGYLAA